MRRYLWFGLFVSTVWVANYVVEKYGVVPVGFGQYGPAAVYIIGFAFIFRDLLQESWSRVAVVAAIIVGAALSFIVSPSFAIASGVAFLISELVDFAVYTPIRERTWAGAIVASNTVGVLFDSVLFLWLATALGPDRMSYLPGQIIGKCWATLGILILLFAWKGRTALKGATA